MINIKKLKLPFVLIIVLLAPLLIGNYVPVNIKSFFYAISLSMKNILIFLLPFIIFSFIFSSMLRLKNGAALFIFLLIICVFISNFTAIITGYSFGKIILTIFPLTPVKAKITTTLSPTWNFTLPKIISNDLALIIGLIMGIIFTIKNNSKINKISSKLNYLSHYFLQNIFVPLLPLFILGFVFKMEYEKILDTALIIYGPIFLLIIGTQIMYLTFIYLVASNFSLKKFAENVGNVLPASLTGFTTISSAASLPVLILSTEKNLKEHKERADMIVPAIINIHTLGSAIGVSILSLATLLAFDLPMPDFHSFVIFAFFFALAKYAVAAVPGGVILIASPLLQKYLGFDDQMIGLITAVYLILDPFGTTMNVTANGAFPLIFNKIFNYFTRERNAAIN